jgi:hypothetical protein
MRVHPHPSEGLGLECKRSRIRARRQLRHTCEIDFQQKAVCTSGRAVCDGEGHGEESQAGTGGAKRSRSREGSKAGGRTGGHFAEYS